MRYWKALTSFLVPSPRHDHPGEVSQARETEQPSGGPAEAPAAAAPVSLPEVRPPGPGLGENLVGAEITFESVTRALDDAQGTTLREYFERYPASSLMSGRSRAMLFVLIRMLRPKVVAEVGTYRAGGAEVMAR